jgi:hypothetical protein
VTESLSHDHSDAEIDRPGTLLCVAEVITVRGILAICAYCKKIEKEQGIWESADLYVRSHSHAELSHGICPECFEALCGKFDRS